MGKVMSAVMAQGGRPGRRQGGFPAGQGASIRVRRVRPNSGGVADGQRGRSGVTAEYVTKHIDLDNRVAALLVGENDSHLRALEQLLDCDISLRGNQLTLEGSAAEVERGEALVDELLALLQIGPEPRPRHPRTGRLPQRCPGGTGPATSAIS